VPHQVLNAKHHEKEAGIVAQAGRSGAVTIATNRAGRGTDIMLGGNPEYRAREDLEKAGYPEEIIVEATGFAETEDAEILAARALYHEKLQAHKAVTQADGKDVVAAGGLCILGTERHESRRIDNQLRGRAGRQGDPGESTFYLSLEDDLMRLFGSERMVNMMESLGVAEDEPINHKMLSNVIESAQSKVESRHFQSRKQVLEYDDVMNRQRELIYGQRMQVLSGGDLKEQVETMIGSYVTASVTELAAGAAKLERLHAQQITSRFNKVFIDPLEFTSVVQKLTGMTQEAAAEELTRRAMRFYQTKEAALGSPIMRELERVVLLRTVDKYWMDHIDAMEELRRGIGLNAYAQVNPVDEYKRQGFDMFDAMVADVRSETARMIFLANVNIKREKVAKEVSTSSDGTLEKKPVRKGKKVGRNDPCPCGSGKKYKHCCGR
jgi:preprotein translocase subunit SecA